MSLTFNRVRRAQPVVSSWGRKMKWFLNDTVSLKCLAFALTLVFFQINPAQAQESTSNADEPPAKVLIDDYGVNVMTRSWLHEADVRLESNIDPDLEINQFWVGARGGSWSNSWEIKAIRTTTGINVTFGLKSFRFAYPQSYTGQDLWDGFGSGVRLRFDAALVKYTLILSDGTIATLEPLTVTYNGSDLPLPVYGTSVVFPNGKTWLMAYDVGPAPGGGTGARLRAIQSSLGLGARITYESAAIGSKLVAMTIFNSASDYCPTSNVTCSFSQNWPSIQHSQTSVTVGGVTTTTNSFTDALGKSWQYVHQRTRMQTVTDPLNQNPVYSIANTEIVGSITKNGINRTYASTDVSSQGIVISRTGIVTDSNSKTKTYIGHPIGLFLDDWVIDSYTDELSRVITYEYDSLARLTRAHLPEGNVLQYTYDARGNVTEKRKISKAPGSPADVVTSFVFPATCTNSVTCNKPTAKIDPRGFQTDFTYDSVHGGLLSETVPAVNGVRPQNRYAYVQRYAWLKNSSGTYSISGPIWLLASESHCRTSSATGNPSAPCATAGDEVLTTYDYGPDSGPNNLLLRGVVVTADGQTRRSCFSYDNLGRKLSETSPNANLTSCP